MSMENILLTAVSAVTGALVFVCKLLWKEAENCKADRIALRKEIEKLKLVEGKLAIMEKCHINDCPFRANFEHRPIAK